MMGKVWNIKTKEFDKKVIWKDEDNSEVAGYISEQEKNWDNYLMKCFREVLNDMMGRPYDQKKRDLVEDIICGSPKSDWEQYKNNP